MTAYQLNERFHTIQGEGVNAGRTSVFIRLQGCPVGCGWCDSKLTWFGGGTSETAESITSKVAELPASAIITITGGEPTLFNLDELIISLRRAFPQREIHIETSGQFQWKGRLIVDHYTVSPKFGPGTKNPPFFVHDTVLQLMMETGGEFKYVVDNDFFEDLPQVHRNRLRELQDSGMYPPVVLMPEGSPPSDANVTRTIAMLERHPEWRFGPRLQYAYGAIEKREGLNNKIVTREEALTHARR